MPIVGDLEPRVRSIPERVDSSGKFAVEMAAAAGLFLDPWQQWVLEQALGERADGRWAAFEVALLISRQNGKGCQELGAPVLTTDGWTTFADIRPGQQVYGSDGQPTEVELVTPVFEGRDCYEVTFTDGASYVVDAGHLWHVKEGGGSVWQDVRTDRIAETFSRPRPDGRREFRYRVRCDTLVDTPPADLPIDPWLLGFWLGDGNRDGARLAVGHEDLDWVTSRVEASGAAITGVTLKDHGHAWNVRFRTDAAYSQQGFLAQARSLGVLGRKHIPEVYLTASVEQRMALLAGLMDSDGSIAVTNRSPQVEFTTSYPDLARGFHRLVRSLGVRATPKLGRSSLNGLAHADRTRFLWTPTFDPFELPRKSARFKPPSSSRQQLMSITDVRRVPSVPVRCIKVAAEDGVYLTGELFTPTHNTILEARELAGLFLLGEKLILHTSHEFKTSADAFRRVSNLIESVPEFDAQVAKVTRSHGDEGIELKSKQRLRFIARTSGSGRGFPADLVILDEAYNLPETAMSALLPTLTTSLNPQVWYASSAVNQEFHPWGQVLARVRRRALRGDDPRLCYLEWSVDREEYELDPVGVANDQRYVAMANPAYGSPRLTRDYVDNERSALWGADGKLFAVERLSIGDWPAEEGENSLIPRQLWMSLMDRQAKKVGPLVFSVDAPPNRSAAVIGVAGDTADGRTMVELIPERFRYEHRGLGWVVRRCVELDRKWKPTCWVIDRGSPAATLIPELEEAGLTVRTTDSTQFAVACGAFYDDAVDRKLAHGGQIRLDSAVAGIETRKLTDRWAFSRLGKVNAAPLCAVTLARHGLRMWGKPKVVAAPIVEKAAAAKNLTDDLGSINF